ncbi:MAG: hypothetical protein P1V97_19020 [Planctomycetota bacterium]|nr:hypothetical protein [Planctomycetota bacterium]
MKSDNETDSYNWRAHAPESTLSPDIVFGFSFDTEDEDADRIEIQSSLLGGAKTMNAQGFSNGYASYVNLDGMLENLNGFADALSRAEELKAEKKLKRWIFWWTPGVHVHKNGRLLDFCSLRNLSSCESFLRRIAESNGDQMTVSGSRADYNDFDYIESCFIQLSEGQLYYADYWERGYVSDDQFDPERVDEPWDYHSYRDADFPAFQSKAKKALEQFIVLREALVQALGTDVLTKKYYKF